MTPTEIIAIDGPAGAGKSTVTRLVAEAVGADPLDTGALYRAVTAAVLSAGVDPAIDGALESFLQNLEITTSPRVTIAGFELSSPELRTSEVDSVVAVVAASTQVREAMRAVQREWASARPSVVVEGRDIGTVVFPDADLKVFLTADLGERARRRSAQAGGSDASEVQSSLAERDERDTVRSHSPLRPAPDASVIDTTTLSLEEVVQRVLTLWADSTSGDSGPVEGVS
ncbi:MAG: (d)CMP kinase [Acidimicrobiales bacterium]|nr:(d)CMP kinase [Acidimicrobiales bacterium]